MRDIQSEEDSRNIALKKVGVRQVRYPVTVLDKLNGTQVTSASVDLFTNLPHNFKGTHMSRFIEIFHRYHNDLTMPHFIEMLCDIRKSLDASCAQGEIRFPYHVEKFAPVTHTPSISCYDCAYSASVTANGAQLPSPPNAATSLNNKSESDSCAITTDFFVSVAVPVTTLCPCSRAISSRGAHNQRALVNVKIKYKKFFWLEDIISIVEQCASAPLYSALKRPDEKFVTEQAYDNPRFVEDVAREVYSALKKFDTDYFFVEVTSNESIHSHDAYAAVEYNLLDSRY